MKAVRCMSASDQTQHFGIVIARRTAMISQTDLQSPSWHVADVPCADAGNLPATDLAGSAEKPAT
jgi:hypothetical protein